MNSCSACHTALGLGGYFSDAGLGFRTPHVSSPVALLVTEVVADLVHDGGARQDVGFVFFLVVALHHHNQPIQ